MSIQTFQGIEGLGVGGDQTLNRDPPETKRVQPTRGTLVSLLTVFVLLSTLLAKCLQTSRAGAVNLLRQVYCKKLDSGFRI